ncbi:hypothetical protein Q8A73_019837 [Channa argus]|nr:hypothetical protein Q8A73_019837 [Channa argus]
MDWTLVLVLQVMFQPSLSVLFTVDAEQTTYKSEFGGDVVMGCKFQPKPSNPQAQLKVTWHWLNSTIVREVYQLNNGLEHPASQEYKGRVRLLTEELKEGWAKLQVSRLRINDSGTYQCLVQTGEGADYKTITLSVVAPYKAVTKSIKKTVEGDKVLLTCQSEGYPETYVVWQDGHLQTLSPNTTAVSTSEQLFKVTSQIHVSSMDRSNYTCNFLNDGHSATFHIPDDMPTANYDGRIFVLCVGILMGVIIVAMVTYQRQKGFKTRNLLANGHSRPASPAASLFPSGPQKKRENEEERIILSEDCVEENLRAVLKAHYCDVSFSTEVRGLQETFDVEELPRRLQNNEGEPVNLQALLPEAGETLFLEGPPGSGKTSVAYMLVSSWTEGNTHPLSNFLDLSGLQLLLYVDCTSAKSDLFHEIKTQLSLKENVSAEDELRTMLNTSSETLLLLDGYREGNTCFDESLKGFLSERRGSRVLVLACQEHCITLKETAGTGQVLKLQTQIVKY